MFLFPEGKTKGGKAFLHILHCRIDENLTIYLCSILQVYTPGGSMRAEDRFHRPKYRVAKLAT